MSDNIQVPSGSMTGGNAVPGGPPRSPIGCGYYGGFSGAPSESDGDEEEQSPSTRPDYRLPIGALVDAEFTDLKITCHDEFVLDCNKFVVTRESQIMRRALLNPTSKESLTNTFNIGLDGATPETTRLFIECLYEGYSDDKMGAHIHQLLRLAHCYQCERLMAILVDAVGRVLTFTTFWTMCDFAVTWMDTVPSLLNACAVYAAAAPHRFSNLRAFGDRDPTNDETKNVETFFQLMTAMCALPNKH